MEIKAQLIKPYTENERLNFIVEQNYKLGYEIKQVEVTYEVEEQVPYTEIETEEIQEPIYDEEGNPILDDEGNPTYETKTIEKEVTKYKTEIVEKTGYNLEAWGDTEDELQQKERKRLDNLSMTRGDVFEALILSKGITKPQIRLLIEESNIDDITKALYLNRFDEALEFYRGYPIFDMLSSSLGINSEQLDKFFDTKDWRYLTNITLTINTIPETAVVTLNGIIGNSISVPYNTIIEYTVNDDLYIGISGKILLTENKTLEIELEPIE